jgi:hypothetical protein
MYQAGPYKAIVKDDNTVDVYNGDTLIDWPGPWDTPEGAHAWAAAIVETLNNPEPTPTEEPA